MTEDPGAGGTMPLAKASLALGLASVALVFGIGLCAIVGTRQGWIRLAGPRSTSAAPAALSWAHWRPC